MSIELDKKLIIDKCTKVQHRYKTTTERVSGFPVKAGIDRK